MNDCITQPLPIAVMKSREYEYDGVNFAWSRLTLAYRKRGSMQQDVYISDTTYMHV